MFIVTPTTKLGIEETFAVFGYNIFHLNKKLMYFKSVCSSACCYSKSTLGVQKSFLLAPYWMTILINEKMAVWWHSEFGREPPFLQLDATLHSMCWNKDWFVLRPEGLLSPLICHLAKYHAFPVVICVLFILLFRTCPEELSQTEI